MSAMLTSQHFIEGNNHWTTSPTKVMTESGKNMVALTVTKAPNATVPLHVTKEIKAVSDQ